MIQLLYPKDNALIPLISPEQKRHLFKHCSYIDHDLSFPLSVTFEWDYDEPVTFSISKTPEFYKAKTYIATKKIELSNLCCDERYFWKVFDADRHSYIYTFTTDKTLPRLINIDGLSNVRDCGGWYTSKGYRLKQGLLYRGSELNNTRQLTEIGKKTMLDDLHIQTILDLRHENEFLSDVYKKKYVNIPISAYSFYLQDYVSNLEIMKLLCDINNYPVYIHCCSGADRTGTLVSVLNILLGVSIDDVILDYEASSLSVWGDRNRNANKFTAFLDSINKYNGNDYAEKIKNFMLYSGVTQSMIDDLFNIFIKKSHI